MRSDNSWDRRSWKIYSKCNIWRVSVEFFKDFHRVFRDFWNSDATSKDWWFPNPAVSSLLNRKSIFEQSSLTFENISINRSKNTCETVEECCAHPKYYILRRLKVNHYSLPWKVFILRRNCSHFSIHFQSYNIRSKHHGLCCWQRKSFSG